MPIFEAGSKVIGERLERPPVSTGQLLRVSSSIGGGEGGKEALRDGGVAKPEVEALQKQIRELQRARPHQF